MAALSEQLRKHKIQHNSLIHSAKAVPALFFLPIFKEGGCTAHTYITNLIHAGVDPKTVQHLAGQKNSKVTMDILRKSQV